MSIEGGLFQKPLYGLDNISLKKGEEKSATIVINQFDPSNNAKNAKLCLDVYIGESEKVICLVRLVSLVGKMNAQ